jgi:hypothetical protein
METKDDGDVSELVTDVGGVRHNLTSYYIRSGPSVAGVRWIFAGYWPGDVEAEGYAAVRESVGERFNFQVDEAEFLRMLGNGVINEFDPSD